MFCGSCGREIPNGSAVCNYCGRPQMAGAYSARSGKGIDNIFSALVHEKTQGAIMEFVLWCITCVIVVMAMIAGIIGHGNSKVVWLLLMVFAIGLGVITAFRLKPIALLYSVGVFNLIIAALHFGILKASKTYTDSTSFSVFNIILFVVEMLLAVGIVTCAFIHFFSRIELGNVMTILLCVYTGVAVLLHIMMYAMPYTGEYADDHTEYARYVFSDRAYWYGTIVYWLMLVVVLLYYIFFFWGAMDSSKGKILSSLNGYGGGQRAVGYSAGGSHRNVNAGIVGVSGAHNGETIYLQGRTLTVGSNSQMMVNISSPYVSSQHCAIRFNNNNGFYEIYDNSTNGVFLSSGKRLQKGVYNAVPRGEVISIGSNEQRFKLL